MAKKFESVGRRAKNNKHDSKLVHTWLNRHIDAGSLTGVARLDLDAKGSSPQTIAAIERFQEQVLGIPPTGRVSRYSDTHVSLRKSAKSATEIDQALDLIWDKLDDQPVGEIEGELWWDGLLSLSEHISHPRLTKHHIVTFVDFRLDKKRDRLWVVDLRTHDQLINCMVSHGSGSDTDKDQTPDSFGGSYESACGAFVTTTQGQVDLGQPKIAKADKVLRPGVRLVGLDETTQKRARKGVMFHGADYVKATKNRMCGNSGGCFATSWDDNNRICSYIRDGSFVYSYAGLSHMPTI